MIYLDNAATSMRKPFCVLKKVCYETIFKSINAGRGTYKKSLAASLKMINAAEEVAELFNIDDISRIAFTQNATYAINMLILGYVSPCDHVIITGMEHNSVLRPVYKLGNFSIVKPDIFGNINPDDVRKEIKSNTKLIICNHASNVCGTIQPIYDIGKIARDEKITFMVDASQTAGILDIDVKKMNIDMLAFSGHKGLMGPLGTGGLYISPEISLKPVITGGTGSMSESFTQPDIMPDMLMVGTQNTPAISALGEAIRYVKKRRRENFEKEMFLANKFIEDVLNINKVIVYGNLYKKRNATVAINIENIDPILAAEFFEEKYKILVRSGFHCAPLAHKSINTGGGCIRFSFGWHNRISDVRRAVLAVNELSKIKDK